ncbi:type III toxin-antitoxin system ToxN/AbiQ family toxin [Fusobacterium polymorphum]|uniref:type III toxin-antitoxin system ToxN/AbiQ family toxin n=1 Tax=Fusobacterium nucleatum subsp. polymorphum TaxID=76857 RepID=UPI003008C493
MEIEKYLEENPVYWCRISKKYIKYLKKIEPKIINIRYKGEKIKPLFVPLFLIENDLVYMGQILTYKKKFDLLEDNFNFIKIYSEKGTEILGKINLNYMFPVPKNELFFIDSSNIKYFLNYKSKNQESGYTQLSERVLKLINSKTIVNKSKDFYNKVINRNVIENKFLNFKLLEEEAKKWDIKFLYLTPLDAHIKLNSISYSNPQNWIDDLNEKILPKKNIDEIGVKCFYSLHPDSLVEDSINSFIKYYLKNNPELSTNKIKVGIFYKFKDYHLLLKEEDKKIYEEIYKNCIEFFRYGKVYPVFYSPENYNIKNYKESILEDLENDIIQKDKIIFESGILHLLLVKSGKYSQEREYRIIKRFNKKNTLKIGNKIFYTERSDNLKEVSLFIFKKFEDMNLNKKEEAVLLRILHEALKNENRIFFLNKRFMKLIKVFLNLEEY